MWPVNITPTSSSRNSHISEPHQHAFSRGAATAWALISEAVTKETKDRARATSRQRVRCPNAGAFSLPSPDPRTGQLTSVMTCSKSPVKQTAETKRPARFTSRHSGDVELTVDRGCRAWPRLQQRSQIPQPDDPPTLENSKRRYTDFRGALESCGPETACDRFSTGHTYECTGRRKWWTRTRAGLETSSKLPGPSYVCGTWKRRNRRGC